MNKNNKLLQEEIKRILFISNYNLNNPPKIIKENYYDQQEIEYSKIEKENEKGYPANHQYENEYMIDEQPAGKKPVGRPPKKEPAAAPSAGEVPELPPIDNKQEPPVGVAPGAPGEETPVDTTTPPPMPETPPEEEKKEPETASKSDVKDVEKDIESVGDYSKKVMTQQAEILASIQDLTSKLGGVDQLSQKVDKLSSDVGEMKPPSYKDQLEMISLKSGPFNQTLSDYWGADDNEESEKEPEKLTLDKSDIINYDQNEIKNSLFSTGDKDEEESMATRRKMGY